MAEERRGSRAWIGGVATLLVGIAFLWRYQGPAPRIDATRWWAWMLLLPAITMLVSARRHWVANRRVGGSLLAALMIVWVVTVLLLGLPFGGSWPLLMIVMGLYLIVRTAGR